MKKVFPLMVVLITLSVLGIIFIQMSWIRNAIDLRKQQHDQDIADALYRIREGLYSKYFGKNGWVITDEDSKTYFL